jgi:hypothetical protein
MALASTAGGGTWKTFAPGKMPQGRLITTGDLRDVAERGLAGERLYLRGQFVVNFAESNRAVLRPKSNMAESVLRLGTPSSTRIIVEFPSGYARPRKARRESRRSAPVRNHGSAEAIRRTAERLRPRDHAVARCGSPAAYGVLARVSPTTLPSRMLKVAMLCSSSH